MLELYDTTLRDGAQGEGISFSIEDKLQIIMALDSLGVHFIEAGYPGSNPKDAEFFKQAKNLKLKTAKIVPFGSTAHPKYNPEEDPNLAALLKTSNEFVTIFGKSSLLHVRAVLKITSEKNLELIEESVHFLTMHNRKVIYDAEHFFDGFFDNPKYALKTLASAEKGGARTIVLCDTNGGRMPYEIKKAVAKVKREISIPIGIHAHNDSGVAVANTISAVRAGAEHIQGTINGYGERCGNANLVTIIPLLQLKMGIKCISDKQLKNLTHVSRLIDEIANLPVCARSPFVGMSAFAHKGGVHSDAVRKNRLTYEHIDPALVGNNTRILISDQAGRSAILEKIKSRYGEYGKESPEVKKISAHIKTAEQNGYQYEAADASFELLAKKIFGKAKTFFTLLGFSVIIKQEKNGALKCKATVELQKPNGKNEQSIASGNGPVDALYNALIKLLSTWYPALKQVRLTDYKVRILDPKNATAAKTRVLITSDDGNKNWTTVGVSENIIKASLQAIIEGLEYKLYSI